jgi:cytoskeleton protein RodZ
MSDVSAVTDESSGEIGLRASECTGVALLKRAREDAGLHVVALAAMLKVPVSKLEALEAGRFEELPDATFTRALASSVCRALKIDAAPVLASLPKSERVKLVEEGSGLNTPFPRVGSAPSVTGETGSGGKKMSRPALAAVAMLVLAGVLWIFLPDQGGWSLSSWLPVATTQTAVQEAPPAKAEPTDGVSPAAVSTSVVAEPVKPEATELAAPALPAPSAPDSASAAVETPRPETQQASHVLFMRAKEATWVQVTGGSGRVLVQRSLQPSETASIDTDLPLTVVVGRADATEVIVRGEPYDTLSASRNNVARFEVK